MKWIRTKSFTSTCRNTTFISLFCFSAFISGCGGGSSNQGQSSDSNQPPIVVANPLPIMSPPPLTLAPIADFECSPGSSVGLSTEMEAAVTLAESLYTDLPSRTASSTNKYISYTETSGLWELRSPTIWTSGFLPGTYWYLYGLTGTESWRVAAETSSLGVRERATGTDNDTGFQIYSSYGVGRNILGGVWDEADTAIDDAANTLIVERYNPTIGAFRSWPQRKDDPFDIDDASDFEVNVDMLMNMEALLSAAEKSGDNDQLIAVTSHADVSWENIFRVDASSHHVAAFDADGILGYTRTHQGWTDESTWSRGQSWAVYGYAMLHRYTDLPRMLERSEQAYQFFKQSTLTQNSNWVPYADFNAPVDIRNPLDTSAAAIVASAAIELYEITGNTLYLDDANDIINELVEGYLSTGTSFESLLISASEQYVNIDDDLTPDAEGYEVGAIFGDFYFLEALYRLKNTEAPVCN